MTRAAEHPASRLLLFVLVLLLIPALPASAGASAGLAPTVQDGAGKAKPEPQDETEDGREAPANGLAPQERQAPSTQREEHPVSMDSRARRVDHDNGLFGPDPVYPTEYDPNAQVAIYGNKYQKKTTRPLVEVGRRLYQGGPYNPEGTVFGRRNPTAPSLLVFGDWRNIAAYNDNDDPKAFNGRAVSRFNLNFDLKLTSTERIHAFIRPFEKREDGQNLFTRLDTFKGGKGVGDDTFSQFNAGLNFDGLFFEGDWGPIIEGITGKANRIDLPFAIGLMPMIYQNGIWVEDAFEGFAFAFPAKNNAALGISNFDVAFFMGADKVSNPTVFGFVAPEQINKDPDKEFAPGGKLFFEKANVYGVTTFMEANEGYYEFGYAYVDGKDQVVVGNGIEIGNFDRDFHSITGAFTHRFGATLSNSIRVVAAVGQRAREIDPRLCRRIGDAVPVLVDPLQCVAKTANGAILLIENAFITSRPYTFIPYFNAFVGYDKPQSLMRDPAAGGILKNTGLLFEADALSGFPSLDSSGHDAYGAAFGLEWLFGLDKQLVVEVAGQNTYDDPVVLGGPEHGQLRGAEAGVGLRYQMPLVPHMGLIMRIDGMYGYRDGRENLAGGKLELRVKF